MAKVKDFKKDIDFVVNELVIECFTYNYLFPEKNKEELSQLIADVVNTGEGLIKKVNAVKRNTENTAKVQFREIRNEFDQKISEFVKRIENLEKE